MPGTEPQTPEGVQNPSSGEQARRSPGQTAVRVLALLGAFCAGTALVAAAVPSWWQSRGVLNTNANASTNDFAPATLGQLKWTATKAKEELEASLPGGAGTQVAAKVGSFATTNNFYPANIGQGKAVAQPFHERLIAEGYTNAYPWTGTNANDYAPLLIGQLKTLFAFDPGGDADGDGIPDINEMKAGTSPNNATSYPVVIRGTVTALASTTLTNPICVRVRFADGANSGAVAAARHQLFLGSYAISNIPNNRSYLVDAFTDGGLDTNPEPVSVSGQYTNNPLVVTAGRFLALGSPWRGVEPVDIHIGPSAGSGDPPDAGAEWVLADVQRKTVAAKRKLSLEGVPGFLANSGIHYRSVSIDASAAWEGDYGSANGSNDAHEAGSANAHVSATFRAVTNACESRWDIADGLLYAINTRKPAMSDPYTEKGHWTWSTNFALWAEPGDPNWQYQGSATVIDQLDPQTNSAAPPSIAWSGALDAGTSDTHATGDWSRPSISYGSISITPLVTGTGSVEVTLASPIDLEGLVGELRLEVGEESQWAGLAWNTNTLWKTACPDEGLHCSPSQPGLVAERCLDEEAGTAAVMDGRARLTLEDSVTGRIYKTAMATYTVRSGTVKEDIQVRYLTAVGNGGELAFEPGDGFHVLAPAAPDGCTYVESLYMKAPDLVVCWSSNGSVNLANELDSGGINGVAWSMAVEEGASATLSTNGLLSFGTSGGKYNITAQSTDFPGISSQFKVTVIRIAFTTNIVGQRWKKGQEFDARNYLDPSSSTDLEWSFTKTGGADLKNNRNGTFIHAPEGTGTYTIVASSPYNTNCLATLKFKALNLEIAGCGKRGAYASSHETTKFRVTDDSETNVVWTVNPIVNPGVPWDWILAWFPGAIAPPPVQEGVLASILPPQAGAHVALDNGYVITAYSVTVASVEATNITDSALLHIYFWDRFWGGVPGAFSIDPINAVNGNMTVTDADLLVPCPGIDLAFERHYGSRMPAPSGGMELEAGWSHNYDIRMMKFPAATYRGQSGNWRVMATGAGEQFWFKDAGDGTFSAPAGVRAGLTTNAGGSTVRFVGGATYEFDTNNVLQTISMPGGHSLSLVHTNIGGEFRLKRVTHNTVQRSLVFAYDSTNLLLGSVSLEGAGSGRVGVVYTRDTQGKLTQATRIEDGIEFPTRYEYDGDGYMTNRINPSGERFTYKYGAPASTSGLSRVAKPSVGLHLGTEEYYGHSVGVSSNGGASTISYRRDATTFTHVYQHDTNTFDLGWSQTPSGETSTYSYNSNGHVTGVVASASAASAKVRVGYDGQNNVSSVGFQYGSGPEVETTFTSTTNGLLATASDPHGMVTSNSWLEGGLLGGVEISGGGISLKTGLGYEGGLVTKITNAAGHVTSFAYDGLGYLTTMIPPAGPAVAFTRDEFGNATSVRIGTGASARVITNEVTAGGRVTGTIYPDNLGESYAYDAGGRLTNFVDRAGRATKFEYLPSGKLAATLVQYGGNWIANRVSYDEQFNLYQVKDEAGNNVETYFLDNDDRVVQVDNNEVPGQTAYISNGLGGQVMSIQRFDGSFVTNDYDSRGRLSSVIYSGVVDQVTNLMTYSAGGRLLTLSGAGGSLVSNTYDGIGRVVAERQQSWWFTNSVQWTFDISGRLANVHMATGGDWSVAYAYDAGDRLSSIADRRNVFAVSYDTNNGLVSGISPGPTNGVNVTNAYDVMDRVTDMVWKTAGGTVLRSFQYQYNAVGLITNRLDQDGVATRYGYDALDRLVSVQTVGSTNLYEYDLVGNRQASTSTNGTTFYVYAGQNRLETCVNLTAQFVRNFCYDGAGNTTNWSDLDPSTGQVDLAWNARYELVEVKTNGTVAEQYGYDAAGRRVRIVDVQAGVTNTMVYDGVQVVADYENGVLARTYTWGPGIDNLLAMTVHGAATRVYYALKDHLGSVVAMADTNGAIVESYAYDAWGVVTACNATGGVISASAIGNRYLFQGREYSWSTGLYNFRARWYDPATARWLSKDPIGISGGKNLYRFCGNNPVSLKDPLGLEELQDHPYETVKDAAYDGLKSVYPKSKKDWHEYGGLIYEYEGKIYRTEKPGGWNSTELGPKDVPEKRKDKCKLRGAYHTHPRLDQDPTFSSIDYPGMFEWQKESKVPLEFYLGKPDGGIDRFEPMMPPNYRYKPYAEKAGYLKK